MFFTVQFMTAGKRIDVMKPRLHRLGILYPVRFAYTKSIVYNLLLLGELRSPSQISGDLP